MGAGALETNSQQPTDDAYERKAKSKEKTWRFHNPGARRSKASLNRLLILTLQLFR
jgi:hypothetical protein